jgi:hypothetical protein
MIDRNRLIIALAVLLAGCDQGEWYFATRDPERNHGPFVSRKICEEMKAKIFPGRPPDWYERRLTPCWRGR